MSAACCGGLSARREEGLSGCAGGKSSQILFWSTEVIGKRSCNVHLSAALSLWGNEGCPEGQDAQDI